METSSDIKIISCSTIFDESICRLCASKCRQIVNVYDEEVESLDLINIISQCLQIKISINDVLPKDICLTCCEKLREYFEFYTLCADSQETLEKLYGTTEPDVAKALPKKVNLVEQTTESEDGTFHSPPAITTKIGTKRMCKRKLRKPLKIIPDSIIGISESILRDDNDSNTLTLENDSIARPEIHPAKRPDDEILGKIDSVSCNERITTKKLFENYVWECTACNVDHTSLSGLRAHHQEVHKQVADFKCMKCGKIYGKYRSFVRHVKLHNDPKRFTCQTCGKKFAQKTALRSHTTVHSEERPHVCPQCGKAFKQYSSLYLHSKSHLPVQAKPKFHCPMCKQTFSSKHTMENHIKIHTGEKNYSCGVCAKSFITKGSLNYHILSHDDAKNHACSLCKKSFKTARLLAKHSSLHTGVKPHQCDVCGKQFRERSALKEHARIHTGEMPYVCEYCGKAFRFKGILTIHIRQHTGERPYRCAECSRGFTNWANYNKHMRRRHDQRMDTYSPPSVSLPSLDFGDPSDFQLSADSLNIQDFVVDPDIFRIPPYNSSTSLNYYSHFPAIQSGGTGLN